MAVSAPEKTGLSLSGQVLDRGGFGFENWEILRVSVALFVSLGTAVKARYQVSTPMEWLRSRLPTDLRIR
jgi:hypothetical protein